MILNPLRSVVSNHFLRGVSLDRVKEQLKILDDDDNDLLIQYIEAATCFAEEWMGRFILPATVEAIFNSCCSCSYKNYRLNKREFDAVDKIEVLQDSVYVELTTDQYTVTRETWETFVCINDDVEIDCTVENGCQTNPETVKITYHAPALITRSITSITPSGTGNNQIGTVITSTDHDLKTTDLVIQSDTGQTLFDGVFGVTVIDDVTYTFSFKGGNPSTVNTGTMTTFSVPPQIELALMQMVARMYQNRGDCCDKCGQVPCSAQALLRQYRRYIVRGAGSSHDCHCW